MRKYTFRDEPNLYKNQAINLPLVVYIFKVTPHSITIEPSLLLRIFCTLLARAQLETSSYTVPLATEKRKKIFSLLFSGFYFHFKFVQILGQYGPDLVLTP